MNNQTSSVLCPDDALEQALARINQDDADGLAAIKQLLRDYDHDPRLHFLRGSLLAGAQRYDEALTAMKQALDIAPDYAIARFQFGFLALTCGDAERAETIWRPLAERPEGDSLRFFAEGLSHMIRDEFEAAKTLLERGIAANEENLPLNADMRLIIDELGNRQAAESGREEEGLTSSAQSLLRQYAARSTKH